MNPFLRHPILLFLLITSVVAAQNPNGYYNTASGKQKEQLKTSLHKIIRNHTVLEYNSLWLAFRQTDSRPDGTVWDMYSSHVRPFTSYELNREHAFPKSWWGGDRNAAYTDLHHIYPSDGDANMAKSNYPLGEAGSNPIFYNGVTTVGNNTFPGYTGVIFEPHDDYKGDFARTYFYMVTCYQDYYNQWRYFYMINANTYPVLRPWAVTLLLKWHRNDPVSPKELERNDAVFKLQNNRNPFIDYPNLPEYIWGDSMEVAFVIDTDDNPAFILPAEGTELQFGTVIKDQTSALTLYVKGRNLTGEVSVMLFGKNPERFSLSTTTISAALTTTEVGYPLVVSYSPTEVSDGDTATIVIYDGGFDGSVTAGMYGNSISYESFIPPTATAATHISSTGFRANWEVSPGTDTYILEVYAQREGSQELILREEDIENNYFDVTGLEEGLTYSYLVKRVIGGVTSEPSNPVLVTTATHIPKDVAKEHVQVWSANYSLFILNNSSVPEHINIYSLSGKLVKSYTAFVGLKSIEVDVPGVYIIDIGGDVRKVMVR